MKKNWVWFVFAAAVLLAAAMVVSGRLRTPADDVGPTLSEGDMPNAEDFENVPPTGADMNLDEMSVSFANETNKTVQKTGEAKPAK